MERVASVANPQRLSSSVSSALPVLKDISAEKFRGLRMSKNLNNAFLHSLDLDTVRDDLRKFNIGHASLLGRQPLLAGSSECTISRQGARLCLHPCKGLGFLVHRWFEVNSSRSYRGMARKFGRSVTTLLVRSSSGEVHNRRDFKGEALGSAVFEGGGDVLDDNVEATRKQDSEAGTYGIWDASIEGDRPGEDGYADGEVVEGNGRALGSCVDEVPQLKPFAEAEFACAQGGGKRAGRNKAEVVGLGHAKSPLFVSEANQQVPANVNCNSVFQSVTMWPKWQQKQMGALNLRRPMLVRMTLPNKLLYSPSYTSKGRRQGTQACRASLRHEAESSPLSHTETATFSGRDEGNVHSETYLILRREPTSAVEAGRSKAKKGGLGGPGGKIERRPPPPPPQKVPRKRPGSSDTDGKDGSKSKQMEKGERVAGSNQGKSEAGRTGLTQDEEEDDDISWLLEDISTPSSSEKKTKLVGGWGRDKSMQREVPARSEAKLRGAKGGNSNKSSPGGKRTSGKLPPVPIDDPTVRYPDKDYIEGPFGPYAWRGVCIGKPIEGDFATTQVVFFSNVVDDEEKEDRERFNYTVEYTDKVDKFDEDVGVVYYYVFARGKYGPRQEPWRDWTLAAQLAIESREELDQRLLFSRLTPNIQNIMLKCVAWVRPDLIYVRKPRLQLRLEPQEKFMTELLDILNQQYTPNSYYGKLCQIVRVQPTRSSKAVKSAYDALSEEEKLECQRHLLTEHPVKLLACARYDRIAHGMDDENSVMDDDPDFAGVELSMDTCAPTENGNDGEHVESMSAFDHEEHQTAGDLPAEREGASGEEAPVTGSAAIQKYTHRKNRYEPEPGPPVRSAVRPFDYSHLVEEIATIHNILHGSDSSTEWIREAVNSR